MSFSSRDSGQQMSFDFRNAEQASAESPSEYSRFAERVLPLLYLCRNARRTAQVLVMAGIAPSATRIAHDFVRSLADLDARIRVTGVYDLSEVNALENDHARMDEVCQVLEDVIGQLRKLTLNAAEQITQTGDRAAMTIMAPLIEALKKHASEHGPLE